MFHCINLKLYFSHHQCVDICAVSTFWLSWKMMLWPFMHKFLCKSIFFFWFIKRNRISGSYGDCLFNFLRSWQNVDQNIWISLHSHWQGLFASFLWVLTNTYYLFYYHHRSCFELVIVVWISIPLMSNTI